MTRASLFSPQGDRIKHLLDNAESGSGKASVLEKTEGMKYLLAVRRPIRKNVARSCEQGHNGRLLQCGAAIA
jgi:hypothetical protein